MMDILLSLPILSFFFSSSTTSMSTSLNILFFYMTWSTLLLSHKPLNIQIFGTLAIRLLFYLVPSLLFLLFDTLLPSLAVSIKHGGRAALPPRDPRALARTLLLALLNLVLATAVEAAGTLGLTFLLAKGAPFRVSTTLPLPFAVVKQLAWLYAARELLTYCIHRTVLHSHRLRRRRRLPGPSSSSASAAATGYAARRHAAYAHHRRAPPYALLACADHPVPFLLHRFAPVYLPALAVRPHLLVYFLFVALTALEDAVTMSGYTVVPGFVMGGIARRSAAHYGAGHCGADSGNYGAWGLLDWVGGTSMGGEGGGNLGEDVRDEARQHRVKERGQNAVQNGIDGIRSRGKGRGKGRRRASGSE